MEVLETPEPSPAPTPCEGRKWYLKEDSQNLLLCTNGYDIPPDQVANMDYFDTVGECCMDAFGGVQGCNYVDVCVPTGFPSPEPTTDMPSPVPTFGSTPTVSKETTGPPTMAAIRGTGRE